MAKQIINIGTTANDGTGDTLRESQRKANDNFTELYDADSGFETRIAALETTEVIERYTAFAGFPATGFEDTLYVDESDLSAYLWDDFEGLYFQFGGAGGAAEVHTEVTYTWNTGNSQIFTVADSAKTTDVYVQGNRLIKGVGEEWNVNTATGVEILIPLADGNKVAIVSSATATEGGASYDDTALTQRVTDVEGDLLTPVPLNALFTDTVYNDTAIQAEVDLNTAKVSNIDHPLVETAVPVGAVFTDTVYEHPTNHPPSIISQDSNNRFVTDAEKLLWSSYFKRALKSIPELTDHVSVLEDKNKLLYFGAGTTYKVPKDVFSEGDVLIGYFAGNPGETLTIIGNDFTNGDPTAIMLPFPNGTQREVVRHGFFRIDIISGAIGQITGDLVQTDVLSYALSSPTADLTAGDSDSFTAPYDFTLNGFFIGLNIAPTGSSFVGGLKKNTVSVTSSDAIIDAGEFTSLTGTAPVITTTSFLKGDVITPTIVQVGSLETGKSYKIYLQITKI